MKQRIFLFLFFLFNLVMINSVYGSSNITIDFKGITTENISNSGNFTNDIYNTDGLNWTFVDDSLLIWYNFSIPYVNGISTYQNKFTTSDLQSLNKTTKILNSVYSGHYSNYSNGLYMYNKNPVSNPNAVGYDIMLNDTYEIDGLEIHFCNWSFTREATHYTMIGTGVNNFENNDTKTSGFTFGEGYNSHVHKNLPLRTLVNRLFFFYYVNNVQIAEDEWSICEIILYNATSSNNQLPYENGNSKSNAYMWYVGVTENKMEHFNNTDVCYSDNRTSVNVNLLLEGITDREDDDIYYLQPRTVNFLDVFNIDYNDDVCIFGICYKKNIDYHIRDWLDSSSNCNISASYDLDLTDMFFTIVTNPFIQDWDFKYMLQFKGNACGDKAKSFTIKTPSPYNNMSFETTLYRFGDGIADDDKYNLIFENYNHDILMNLSFVAETNNISVYSYGIKLLSYDTTANGGFLYQYLHINLTDTTLNVDNAFSKYSIQVQPNNQSVSYITQEFTVESDYAQNGFKFGGTFKNTFSWGSLSLERPNNVTLYRDGVQEIRLLVTDSYHKDLQEYTILEYKFNIPNCRYQSGGVGGDNQTKNVEEFRPLAWARQLLGIPMRNYINAVDSNNIAGTVLWWLFGLLTLGLLCFNWVVTKQASLTIPLIISSIACGTIAFLMGFTGHLVVILICLSFGLGVPLALSLLAESGGK